MNLPVMPRVLYAQMWRRKDDPDRVWHPLHPWGDGVPAMQLETPRPAAADRRYEVRVVRYELVMLSEDDA